MGFGKVIDEETKWTETWNGAAALRKSGSKCVDFFGRAGAMRQAETIEKLNLFDEAWNEDADIALKLLFYARDVRGGYGERDTFNEIFAHLADLHPDTVEKNLWAVLEFGRAKDLYSLIGTRAEDAMWQFMKQQFELDIDNYDAGKSISLLAKWIATPDSKSENTKNLGKLTAKKLGYSYKTMSLYKKKLRALRKYLDLPEAKMCAGKWDEIEYSKCASKFMLTHRAAFKRHDADRYEEYIKSVEKGEANMNMGTTTPCDIMEKVMTGNYTNDLEAMWKSLPDMNNGNALVVCDTSGSMGWSNCGAGLKPIVVAVALTIYLAERNKGDLKNKFMTFSDSPSFVEIEGNTLKQKAESVKRGDWMNSTNLEAAFELVLDKAVEYKLAADEMPEAIVVISDMQINCVSGVGDSRVLFYDEMSRRFEEKGYKIPAVIFWNVNARNATFHATHDSKGVSMVSGYSPNVFKQVLENIGTTPYELMMAVVSSERYKDIAV
jgi:hypothetical protein